MPIDLKNISSPVHEKEKTSQQASDSPSIWNRDIRLFGRKLSAKQKVDFYTETGVLLNAGLDIQKSLELQQENSEKAIQKEAFEKILTALVQGSSLAESMSISGQFSVYELAGIKIAEESGKLPPILDRLAKHFEKVVLLNRLLISTLSYPILVITVAVGALTFLVTFLVPMFSDIYARLDQELPPVTKLIIQFSDFMQSYLLIGLLLLSILIGMLYWMRKQSWLRRFSSALLLRMPVIGPTLKKLHLSRFCHGLGFLIEARVPLVDGLKLTEEMVSFYPIQQSLPSIRQTVISGSPLHRALSNHVIYPNKLVGLSKVGEEANHLGRLLVQLGNTYDDEVEQQTKLLGSLIEPILIVFLALVIGVVLVAMYLPIFKLVTNFGV